MRLACASEVPPRWLIEVQLATLVDRAPDGDGWLHERKFDGYRIVAIKERGAVTLWSRNQLEWISKLPTSWRRPRRCRRRAWSSTARSRCAISDHVARRRLPRAGLRARAQGHRLQAR